MHIPEQNRQPDKALLVGVYETDSESAQTSLDELKELVGNLSLIVTESVLVKLREKHAGLLLGSGKVSEIIEKAKELGCTYIIFDNELFPSQQRNWEKESKLQVVDRHEVILGIFAIRAKTREAALQVELAQLEYALPRLKRAWTHLERQAGGAVTMRGVGEKQIELDERMIRDEIKKVKSRLKEVIQHRATQRKQRLKVPVPTVAIVGYTNAGKSSLLNHMTGAQVYVANKLFATLDPTTRRMTLPSGQVVLMIDTVGFVQNLPHGLVEAFKATLEESVLSDFLLHVVDVTSTHLEQQIATTRKVLEELGATEKNILLVFTKIDKLTDPFQLVTIKTKFPKASFVSSITGEGIPELYGKLDDILTQNLRIMELKIPFDHFALINELHEIGAIQKQKIEEDGAYVRALVSKRYFSKVEPFIITSMRDK